MSNLRSAQKNPVVVELAESLEKADGMIQTPELLSGEPTVLLTSGGHKEKAKFLGLVLVTLLLLILVLSIGGLSNFKFPFTSGGGSQSAALAIPQPVINLTSANGVVVELDSASSTLAVASVDPNLPKYWRLHITSGSILTTFDEWSRMNVEASKAARSTKKLSDFKVGDMVYVIAQADQDLSQIESVESPYAVIWQSGGNAQ